MNNEVLTDQELYRRCMERVKNRVNAAFEVASKNRVIGGQIETTEFLALQVRKILEGIALASICAHRSQYSEIKIRLEKEWQNSQIILRLNKVNPDWYPRPLETDDGPPDPAIGAQHG
ncbi:MAG: hypothetical protein AAFQ64_17360 [Pseudomonadota bacterium]